MASTSQLTNSAGTITDRYAYDAFGALLPSSSTPTANDWRFTGQQNDYNANRGLYYLRARSYDPSLGRFLQRDTAPVRPVLVQSLDSYAYVTNNPANFVDASGLWCPRNPGDCVPSPVKKSVRSTAKDLGNALGDVGYWDVGGTGCLKICFTIGFQASFGEGIHPYYGTGFGSPQFGITVTYAPGQHIVTGLSCGGSIYVGNGSIGIGGQVGQSGISSGDSGKEGGRATASWYAEIGTSVGYVPGASWNFLCTHIY